MSWSGPQTLQQMRDSATAFHRSGNLAEAEATYLQILGAQPADFGALHLLGVLRFQLGRNEEALELIGKALKQNPRSAEALTNHGLVLHVLGRFTEALATFDKVLAIEQDHPAVHFNRGLSLQELKRLDAAVVSFEKALALKPDYVEAYYHLGAIHCESNRVEQGLASFRRHAELLPPAGDDGPPHKVRHDEEQRAYLGAAVPFHLEDGARLAGPAVNRVSTANVAERWRAAKPQIVVIDDLLTPDALQELRRFCWGSTMWRKVYQDGYLGAMPEFGFACPLLAQIAEELPAAHPAIFGAHPLLYLWAFKYDNQLKGTKVHADFAAVNVNFWITPDEANRDPDSGGLVLWDVAAPRDWDFANYNADETRIRDFLARENAKSITVPYRANRAVIFDSKLFHETDRMAFRDGYRNRRINITLLYGQG